MGSFKVHMQYLRLSMQEDWALLSVQSHLEIL